MLSTYETRGRSKDETLNCSRIAQPCNQWGFIERTSTIQKHAKTVNDYNSVSIECLVHVIRSVALTAQNKTE